MLARVRTYITSKALLIAPYINVKCFALRTISLVTGRNEVYTGRCTKVR